MNGKARPGNAFHRAILLIAAFILLALATLIRPSSAYALQTHISSVTSDCNAIQVSTTLIYTHDDGYGRDHFQLAVYDGIEGHLLGAINAFLEQGQSPYFWEPTLLPVLTTEGLYRVELWDTDAASQRIRRIEQVYHQCLTGASWRPDDAIEDDPDLPHPSCSVWVPVYTTNTAPEPGAVLAVWTYGYAPTDPHYYAGTFEVEPGQALTNAPVLAPCGVYVKVYFQPDSTKQLYFMESQYHPGDFYGTTTVDGALDLPYHTTFPLIVTPTPEPEPEPDC